MPTAAPPIPPITTTPTLSERLPRIGLVSTYPPKQCGLATFAAALARGLRRAGHAVDVVRIDEGQGEEVAGWPVAAALMNGDARSVRNAAEVLSRGSVAIVQHEYGIYGGADGEEVLDLLAALDVPSIVVLHTVLVTPTPHQRSVLMAVIEAAQRVVVMSDTARIRLIAIYGIDPTKVVTVPHGATTLGELPRNGHHAGRAPQLLTWGLLGPGKGIEHAIEALALLGDRTRPGYTVTGITHPKVLARHGDRYRQGLIRRARAVGVTGSVTFDDAYRDVNALTRFVASCSVVVLPYDSRDQVTSGVLVDAIAAGRPVIATAFPHAVELLGSGAGMVVPHADPEALAAAIHCVVSDDELRTSMAAEARRLAPSLSWTSVARRYAGLVHDLVAAPVAG